MKATEAAQKFRDMADRIERNGDEFAGAFLLISPDVEGVPGEALDGMLVNTRPSLAGFWSAAQGAVELEVARVQDAMRVGGRR